MGYTTEIHGTEYKIDLQAVQALEKYKQHGELPGDFLRAVLRNDFANTVILADENNLKNLPAYAQYLWWELPSNSWGSSKKMEKWYKHNGMAGTEEKSNANPNRCSR